ncbi:uncharacterized protein LOC110443270 [Mizuhopecten yessoensis]|uniref:Uncharacterized protein n=1 Tax=Mizuhopecten yessoensis TaxID=6573 RepID=A0A210PFE6_MIZYE|nr:uncharacterized protein LOC110443270 [Mizuhopecten yessoensis]OWF35187.1 hypothetical protein KP79_PYT09666 [Mizuhopecten yessoensis]
MALFPLVVVACSLSVVLGLHILPCEPGMAGELGCDNYFSQSQARGIAMEPEFRDRGLGDQGFGERFGGLNSDQFFDAGVQDQFFDGGMNDQFIVGGQDQFIGGGAQDQFVGGSGGNFVSGGFEPDIGGVQSFGSDQGLLLDRSVGLSNARGDMGLQNFGARGIGISSRFGKGKSRRISSSASYPKGFGMSEISSSASYPKGFGMSKKSRGSFPSIGQSARVSTGMLGFGRQRGYPKFQNRGMGMSKGFYRPSLSYPKRGRSKGGMGGWRGKGLSNSRGMGRSYSKGIGRGRMFNTGSWGQGMAYPKGISRPSFSSSKKRSGGY